MSTTMNALDMRDIETRFPDLMKKGVWQQLRLPAAILALIAYFLFCWWFFALGTVLSNARGDLAYIYLADWFSYEVRPDINIGNQGTMKIEWPRYSPLGADPHPEWMKLEQETVTRQVDTPATPAAPVQKKTTSSFSFVKPQFRGDEGASTTPEAPARSETVTEKVVTSAAIDMNGTGKVDIHKGGVTIIHGKETLTIATGGKAIALTAPLPAWAYQRAPGEKVTAYFGFSGRVTVETDRVQVRKRFLGWKNFFFDTDSLFFGKSAGEVIALIVSGDRLDPKQSNLSLAIDDFLYNPSWQHLDVWIKLLQTIVMAFAGTVLASLVAFPLAFVAARNITHNGPINQVVKRFFDFQRSVDMLIWALFFTRAFGPGPLAGIAAIFFTDTGTLGKLYSEALENIDDKPREGVRSVGASSLAVQRFGVVPQVLPVFVSQALYFWESNTRSATIIGAVGAGGIGLKLWEAMRTNSNWQNVAYMVLLLLIVVYIFDTISNKLRSKLVGAKTT
jgi:phosphonate transport system permease protein